MSLHFTNHESMRSQILDIYELIHDTYAMKVYEVKTEAFQEPTIYYL